tara:strand:+ start:1759 stop:3258 length:1500 start_codon:yes stop_codon:yes gene_type:complete
MMQPTIEPVMSVQIKEYPRSWCPTKDSIMCVGFDSGRISNIDSHGEFLEDYSIEGPVIGLVSLDCSLIAASSTSGLFSLGEIAWDLRMEAGCEHISKSNEGVFVTDGSGSIINVSKKGEILRSKKIGSVDVIHSSDDGLFIGLGLTDGRLMILDNELNTLFESLPADDDVESISCIQFRPDGTLLVGRNSLGMAVDDRPENRLECWNPKEGLINTSEMPSKPTSLCVTEEGVLVGCFDGQLIDMKVGVEGHRKISQMAYMISDITQWDDEYLVSYWFETSRITTEGDVVWRFEHHGVVEGAMLLPNGLVAILGDDKKSRGPSPIYFLNPDLSPMAEKIEGFTEPDADSIGDEFSGSLTEYELEMASKRHNLSNQGEILIETLNEEIEMKLDEGPAEGDVLADLIESAKSLNIPPVADAGDDITIHSDEDGKATVLLDGSRSYDPDGRVSEWLWVDRDGKEIGQTPQLRARISKGVHNFTLFVTDDGGAESSANITIQVR